MHRRGLAAIAMALLCLTPARAHAEESLRDRAEQALRRAVDFYRTRVATEGGYLWRYSEDLSAREGEVPASATMVWVQPPGTPAVGLAYLAAYEATGEQVYLDAARAAADALVRGQLRSGGWDYSIEFDPEARRRFAYRVDPEAPRARNVSTLDDDTTQTALRLLMRMDRALNFGDPTIHEAATFALASLIRAQYPNGAWPQRFEQPPDPSKFPVRKASYPETWSRTFPKATYLGFYTLNDNALADAIEVMLEAHRTYGDPAYRAAAERAGDFLLAAQMPDPQPAWAQQYDAEMHPAWARKFEPPAVSGGESLGALKILIGLARETGDQRFLEPIPRALDYLRRSRLPDGRLARFYELQTNRPLYFTRDYQLTYEDDDLPTHYAFKVDGDGIETIARDLDRLKAEGGIARERARREAPPKADRALQGRVERIIGSLDEQGRWLVSGRLKDQKEAGGKILDSRTFVKNVEDLARYLRATRP